MNIVILDRDTLGNIDLSGIEVFGNLTSYDVTPQSEVLDRLKNADIVLTNKVILNREILSQLPNLKLICITATGVNNVDLQYAESKNIVVKNVSNYSTQSVAQHTMMLALYMLGKLGYYSSYVRDGKWIDSKTFCHLSESFEMYDLENKKWGIIGLGAIGTKVASLASAFGAQISYYSTSGKNTTSNYNRNESLESLLQDSDIVSIHAPLNEQTRNLIQKPQLELLKRGCILINVGRGGIVNETHLAESLRERDFYFASDVLETEPMLRNYPLIAKDLQDRIVITPHIAWAYKESKERLIKGVVQNIKDFIELN